MTLPFVRRRFMRPLVCAMVALAGLISIRGAVERAQANPQSSQGSATTETYRTLMEAADRKVQAEVQAHSELMKNLQYLTTQIGPRLTGSPQMQKASDWTLQRFRDYGLERISRPPRRRTPGIAATIRPRS